MTYTEFMQLILSFKVLPLKRNADLDKHHTMSMSDCRTKSRLILHIGVRVDEVVRLISGKDAGLDEAQQGVELLQVVLDGSPRQQDSEAD